jgi:sec-independent protein translocase protein TatC
MLNYIIEIRRRTIYILSFFSAIFALCFFITPSLFKGLIWPLLQAMPIDSGLIATQITTPLFTPISIAADTSMLLSAPFALFHVWRFIFPALYERESYSLRWVIFCSFVLFLLGSLFCYFLVLPFIFKCIVKIVPSYVHLMPDMGLAVDFITRMLLVFGICFQLPLLSLVLVQLRLITIETLRAIRPYFIVFAFIIGMLLTPPDVFSQILLATPLLILYELSIFIARYVK